MKAYIICKPTVLKPFDRPASKIRFLGRTVDEWLRERLRAAGLEIVECESLEALKPDPHSIAIQHDVLASAEFIPRFLALVKGWKQDLQLAFDRGKLPLFSVRDAATVLRTLPVYYFGERPRQESSKSVELIPEIVFDTSEGMPQRIGDYTNLHLYFLDCYGVHIQHWFDLLVANGVFVREFLVEAVRPFRGILPRRLLYGILGNRWVREHSNAVGKGCRIHPTAVLEGCVIGDGVEIGPYCYLRSSVIADRAVIREKSTVKVAYVGEGASIGSTDVTNCYVGAESFILSQLLNVVIGEGVFLAGGSGFADFIFGARSISASIDGKDVDSGLSFLGSAVGDRTFIGAGLVFAPGRTIPSGVSVLNNHMIKTVPSDPDTVYVASGGNLLQIPPAFLGR